MERFYRDEMKASDLVYFRVLLKQTDMYIGADSDLSASCYQIIQNLRAELEDYIIAHPSFEKALAPISVYHKAPLIAVKMAQAAKAAQVGPMAAVAGAFSQMLADELDALTTNLIIENGGDLYIKTGKPRIVSIYAGENQFKDRLKIRVDADDSPIGICTSSGVMGPSLSFGKADAVTILSKDAFLSDAAATAVGNRVQSSADIKSALNYAMSMKDILGAVIIADDKMGAVGNVKFI